MTVDPEAPKPKAAGKTKASAKKMGDPIPANMTVDPEALKLKSPPKDTEPEDSKKPAMRKKKEPSKEKDVIDPEDPGKPKADEKATKSDGESESDEYNSDEDNPCEEFTQVELDAHFSELECVQCHNNKDVRTPIVRLCEFYVYCLYLNYLPTHDHFIFRRLQRHYPTSTVGYVLACNMQARKSSVA